MASRTASQIIQKLTTNEALANDLADDLTSLANSETEDPDIVIAATVLVALNAARETARWPSLLVSEVAVALEEIARKGDH